MEVLSVNTVEEMIPEDYGFKAPEGKDYDGIGIEKFLQGKVIFITGATGFLAKVLVEKILRTSPDVSKIYLMIRAKNKEDANRRLKTELLDAELFKCVKKKYGNYYEALMMSKLVPVVGNICQSGFGMESDSANEIKKNVQIIVNSAAYTSFYPRYDDTLDINALGPYHLMDFAKKCIKLELFLHISTAYVNTPRTGIIMEQKVCLTNRMGGGNLISKFPPALILENEKKLVSNYKKTCSDNVIAEKIKELALQRAKEFGWPNAYMFAKAMGEMVIDTMREDVEVVIIRPSGIEGTCKEPFPGWIEGNKVLDPLVLLYGKGILAAFPGISDNVIDIVPVDMVVNVTLAAMARHGQTRKAEINIYHVCSSILNTLALKNMFGLFYEHFKSSPSIDENGKPINIQKLKIFSTMKDFHAHILREASLLNFSDMNPSQKADRRKFMELAKYLAKILEPFAFYNYRFDTSNTQRLLESMSEEEKERFGFDVRTIDWKHYITNVHIPGYRRLVMKEKGSSKL